MSSGHDVIVIGGGPNGLTAAALLAKSGRRTLVLERRKFTGGLAAGAEFHPGYRSAGLLHEDSCVSPLIAEALGLERHGLRFRRARARVLALGGESSLLLGGTDQEAAREIGRLSERDAEAFLRWRGVIERSREVLASFMEEPPVDLVQDQSLPGAWGLFKRAMKVRRLGDREMMAFLRLPPLCLADFLGEYFENDLLKAALALPAIAGTWLGPRSPFSSTNLLLQEATSGPGPEGGAPALVAALEKAARSKGVEIRTGTSVQSLLVSGGRVEGVRLEWGEEIRGKMVAASCDPRAALMELPPPGAMPSKLLHRVRHYRLRGTTAQVLLALKAPPRFKGAGEETPSRARIASSLTQLEKAFDAVKYGKVSEEPALEVDLPDVSGNGLAPQAPEGGAVLSALVHFAPYHLEPSWDDAARERLGDRVLEILESHAPGIGAAVAGRKVLSPVDLESEYGISGGHIHHGEHGLDQILIRPVPECYGYATPLPGYWLCGSGSHPGGGLSLRPGFLAAAAMRAVKPGD